MEKTVMELWNRTLKNCRYYEQENKLKYLLREIGVLRGLADVLRISNQSYYTEEYQHFLNIQNELLKSNQKI